jgi:hypothetical protein
LEIILAAGVVGDYFEKNRIIVTYFPRFLSTNEWKALSSYMKTMPKCLSVFYPTATTAI